MLTKKVSSPTATAAAAAKAAAAMAFEVDVRQPALILTLLVKLHILAMASNAEGNSLLAVKDKLHDKNNVLGSWDYNIVNPCNWLFIYCDTESRVIEVNLGDQGLSGMLASDIGSLPYLLDLKLQDNLISGPIPSELGNLQRLTNLDLSNNEFSGEIPSSLGNLTSINTMLLNNNSLQGNIPNTLSLIPTLQMLDLSYNDLNGSIPKFHAKLNVEGNQKLCGPNGTACPGAPAPSTGPSHGSPIRAIVAGVVGSISFLGVSSIIVILSVKRYNVLHQEIFIDVAAEDDPEVAFGQLKKYALRDLQVATDDFSDKNVIGQGGFGKVYKGCLADGSVIAVKRLKAGQNRAGGEQAFQTEVEMISLAVHRNLLRLKGFCVTASERILVYPYMKNGCVASCLHDESKKQALTWPVRKRIALGAAQGLRYLHDHCNPKIIHRDVKAANVLLDENFEAVVGDFGLAKLLDYKNTHVTTNVRGTPGHIAPEYLSTGKSSEKTDVFGYGITLLELITGKRAFDLQRLFEEEVMLLDWVKKLQREKRLKESVDPSLRNDYNEKEAEELIQIALLCTQALPMDRPKMAEVVGMLEGTGLAERWEEWQKVEVVRTEETDMGPHRISKWMDDYGSNLEAIELSDGR